MGYKSNAFSFVDINDDDTTISNTIGAEDSTVYSDVGDISFTDHGAFSEAADLAALAMEKNLNSLEKALGMGGNALSTIKEVNAGALGVVEDVFGQALGAVSAAGDKASQVMQAGAGKAAPLDINRIATLLAIVTGALGVLKFMKGRR